MLLRVPPVVHGQYCSDADSEERRKPKRGRRMRHTSPSPAARFLRVRRNEDVTDNGKLPTTHTVKRSHSYHDIEQATCPEADHYYARGDMATISPAAAVPSNSSGRVRGSVDAKHLLAVEEPRARKSSGGSQKLNDMFSLGLRFGGKGNKEKKKKDKKQVAELPSPAGNPSDDDLTLYRSAKMCVCIYMYGSKLSPSRDTTRATA